MHGLVLGGGIGISAHASHRIVTDNSRLGLPETGIGFVPDVGGTWLLSHAPGELGTHLALTAGSVRAGDALALDLADHFVPQAALPDFIAALESADAGDVIARYSTQAPPSALLEETSWINSAYSGDSMEQIASKLVAVDNSAAAAALTTLTTRSPTALKATLSALRRAQALPDLEAALRQDLRVSLRFLREPDLAEGIRAQVIDKDRNPHWTPATLAAVNDSHIDALFESLGERELALSSPSVPNFITSTDQRRTRRESS